MKYNTPFDNIDMKGQQCKKQLKTVKIINKLVKKTYDGGAGALFTQGSNLLKNIDKGNPFQVAQEMIGLLINLKKFLNAAENKNFRNALISLPYVFSVLKKDVTKDKKNGGDKTNDTSVNKVSNENDTDKNTEKPKNTENTEKKCENQEDKTYDGQTLNYEEFKKKYEEIMNQPDEKKWFSMNLFKKEKFKLKELYEKHDINEILIELNKIDMHDLPIEIASTFMFIKSEIDRIINEEEKIQNASKEKITDPAQNIGNLKLLLKGIKLTCPLAKAASFGMKTAIKAELNTNISLDEAELFKPEILCNLLYLLDKINVKKYEKSMPAGKKGIIKKMAFDTIINDFNKGVAVIDECGLFPVDEQTIKNYKQKMAFFGKEIVNNNLQKLLDGHLSNNPFLNAFKNKIGNLPNKNAAGPGGPAGPTGVVINEIFVYVKDFAEILCEYGIDLELLLYNANKTGIQTGVVLEFLFKKIAAQIEEITKEFGYSVEELTGFSVEELIKGIFAKLYSEGLYNCPNRYLLYKNIHLNTINDKQEIKNNPNNKIRQMFNEVFGYGELLGNLGALQSGKLAVPGNMQMNSSLLQGKLQNGMNRPFPNSMKTPIPKGGNKKKTRKNKIQVNNTRKRYKR